MTEHTPKLAAAVSALQAELPEIKKTERADVQTNKGSYSYNYAGLADISAQILPLLSKHGLAFVATPKFSGERFVLACSLLHVSGEREDGEYPLPTSGTPQALGSAITYGRRYTLCAMTGVAPEDDDDGAAVEAENAAKRGTAQRTARPRQNTPPAATRSRQTAQRQSAAPPLPGETPDRMNDEQRGKVMAMFRELGITDRAERIKVTSEIVGHEVSSANDMTSAEVSKVIDELAARLENAFQRDEEPPPDDQPTLDGDQP